MRTERFLRSLVLLAAAVLVPSLGTAACCYFSAQNADILQPAQKAFLTWDPDEKIETFTVQPKFEGNAQDFGMVIPTPTQPKLHEMPRDFFKHLAVYSIMKKREFPQSKLLPVKFGGAGFGNKGVEGLRLLREGGDAGDPRRPAIKILGAASSAPSIPRSSKQAGPMIYSSGSRTTDTATPAMRRLSTTTCGIAGSSPS